MRLRTVTLGLFAALCVSYRPLLRRPVLTWGRFHSGATDEEGQAALPGDEVIPSAKATTTRAITIRRAPDDVWPWIAQLGQTRGGFYSYDWLENLVGCDIHNAERIVSEWQQPQVGDDVQLAPEVPLTIAELDAGRALVLQGGMPPGGAPPLVWFTWAFVLRQQADGTTRLLARERYGYKRSWVRLIVAPTELISAVMSRKMLLGIRERAERPSPNLANAGAQTRPVTLDRSIWSARLLHWH